MTTPSSAPEQLTVLVVDNGNALQTALTTRLEESEGFRIVGLERTNGSPPALDYHHADAIILDVHLPGLGGLEALGAIRRRWPRSPVIVTTAFGGHGVGEVARRRGASAFLETPFSVGELIDELRRTTRRHEKRPTRRAG